MERSSDHQLQTELSTSSILRQIFFFMQPIQEGYSDIVFSFVIIDKGNGANMMWHWK